MSLVSTNSAHLKTSIREGVLNGLASDGGLLLPSELPRFGEAQLEKLRGATFPELSEVVLGAFLHEEVPSTVLSTICYESFNFPIPLVQLSPQISILELFHGPTCAFKDFGARFMSKLFRYFLNDSKERLTVLTATSGDTGSAVANAFFDDSATPQIRVVVLFPKGKVSPLQERQMTTLGKNIHALEVDGTFDDCQRMVKEALQSAELKALHRLTSANSINFARLLPQALYYLYAYLLLPRGKHPVFSVPSGNLGNLTGGILAHFLGMPTTRFIAACNENDIFPRYLSSGTFSPRNSIATCSNAMDVGNPSNFARLNSLFKGDSRAMGEIITGHRASDTETIDEIRRIHQLFNYQMDPHTAVGVIALRKFLTAHSLHPSTAPGIVLATAHPAKFSATMRDALGEDPAIPKQLGSLMELPTHKREIAPSMSALATTMQNLGS